MSTRRRLLAAATLLAMPALAQTAEWPTGPVRVIVPYPPGGSNDILARILAEPGHMTLENRDVAGLAGMRWDRMAVGCGF